MGSRVPRPRTIAVATAALGGALVAVGAALVCLPAGLIVAGAGLVATGLLGIDVDREPTGPSPVAADVDGDVVA